jgi:hypothetical protein
MLDPANTVAIHELVARYCHILYTRNWSELHTIFLPDSVVGSGPQLGGVPRPAAGWRFASRPYVPRWRVDTGAPIS